MSLLGSVSQLFEKAGHLSRINDLFLGVVLAVKINVGRS